jgi:hypothetical protein
MVRIIAAETFFTPADISTSWNTFVTGQRPPRLTRGLYICSAAHLTREHLTEDARWRYMDCRYHTEQGGMTMHSWVFRGERSRGFASRLLWIIVSLRIHALYFII